MLRVLVLTSLVAVSIAQLTSSCTTCNTNSNYDNSHHRHKRQQQYNTHQVPGFLPNTYQPDAFSSDARRQETLRLNQAFFDSLTQPQQSEPILTPQMDSQPIHIPTMDQQKPQYQHTFKNRPIPVVFADPEDPKHREPTIFVEVHGDDSNATTKSTPTLEFVQFSLEPNEDGIYQSTPGNEPSFFESEATRAIIEALTRDDPRYIQKDFRLEFVDPDTEDVNFENMEKLDKMRH